MVVEHTFEAPAQSSRWTSTEDPTADLRLLDHDPTGREARHRLALEPGAPVAEDLTRIHDAHAFDELDMFECSHVTGGTDDAVQRGPFTTGPSTRGRFTTGRGSE